MQIVYYTKVGALVLLAVIVGLTAAIVLVVFFLNILFGFALTRVEAAEAPLPTTLPINIVMGAEDEIVNPTTKKFVNVLRRELGSWWRNEGRAIAKNAWRVDVSQAYDEGRFAGLLVSFCEVRRVKKVCAVAFMERMRDPAASAQLTAAAIVGTITQRSGKEVTEK